MNFEDFIQAIRDRILDYLLNYNIEHIKIEQIHKNNGVNYTALLMGEKEDSVFPTIYLDYYFSRYNNGVDLDEILRGISEDYKIAREKLEGMQDYADMHHKKENIFLRLVNYEKNKDLLKDCPYIPYLDLAITFRYLAQYDENGIASALIDNKQLKEFNLGIDEMYEIARKNTERLFPPVIKNMADMLEEMTGEVFPKDCKMYVLSNEKYINGATSMIYEEFLREFAECIRMDMYILPSSIHEVLLVPVEEFSDKQELIDMVEQVNENILSKMEFLSDNVYFYDSLMGSISI